MTAQAVRTYALRTVPNTRFFRMLVCPPPRPCASLYVVPTAGSDNYRRTVGLLHRSVTATWVAPCNTMSVNGGRRTRCVPNTKKRRALPGKSAELIEIKLSWCHASAFT